MDCYDLVFSTRTFLFDSLIVMSYFMAKKVMYVPEPCVSFLLVNLFLFWGSSYRKGCIIFWLKKKPKISSFFDLIYKFITIFLYFSTQRRFETVPGIVAVSLQGASNLPSTKGGLRWWFSTNWAVIAAPLAMKNFVTLVISFGMWPTSSSFPATQHLIAKRSKGLLRSW